MVESYTAPKAIATNSISKRIAQLDGLRGLAIILVLFNHFRLEPLHQATPEFLKLVLISFTASGKIGVCILFMLSGYLMATIHPSVTSKLAFWQKRYTRIFPAFLAMCTALVFIRFFWEQLPLWGVLLILITTIAGGGLLWRGLQKLPYRATIGKSLFLAFLAVQIVAALAYVFVLSSVPPSIFYQVWAPWLRYVVFYIGNATMTLPFGVYIPQLDGVYWSTMAEILYYLLYPILLVPVLQNLKSINSKTVNGLVALATVPFFYALLKLSQVNMGFAMLQLHLGIYFVMGAVIGFAPKAKLIEVVQKWLSKVPGMLLVAFGLFAILGLPFTDGFLHFPDYIDNVIWLPVIMVMFCLTLNADNLWSKFLRLKPWLILGQLSFSLYLTHTIAIEMFVRRGDPQSLAAMWTAIGLAIPMTLLLSVLLNFCMEQPYFNKIKSKSVAPAAAKKTTATKHEIVLYPNIADKVVAFSLALIFFVWTGFRVPVALTAIAVSHYTTEAPAFWPLQNGQLTFDFTGKFANLGMMFIHVRALSKEEQKTLSLPPGPDDLAQLNVKVTNEEGTELASNNYASYQIADSRFHPVGLPLDPSSLNQKLTATVSLNSTQPMQPVAFINDQPAFRTAYFFSKKEILTNPAIFWQWATSKVVQPFQEKQAQWLLLCFTPLLALLLGANLKKRYLKA